MVSPVLRHLFYEGRPGPARTHENYRRRDEEFTLEKAARAGVAPEELGFFTIAVKEFQRSRAA